MLYVSDWLEVVDLCCVSDWFEVVDLCCVFQTGLKLLICVVCFRLV